MGISVYLRAGEKIFPQPDLAVAVRESVGSVSASGQKENQPILPLLTWRAAIPRSRGIRSEPSSWSNFR
jgi:hypothetical protein